MDYEKKYNDALDWMRKVYPTLSGSAKEDAEHYFPELKESEDERIRKEIINFLECHKREEPSRKDKLGDWIAYLEKQKEQKPSWTEIDKSRESVVFPFNARVKDSDKVVTIIDGQLNSDGKLWIRFASNEYDGFKVYNPEDLLVEQKPAEWSEEDEGLIDLAVAAVEDFYDERNPIRVEIINRLKSLRPQPHWKPSKEQMKALNGVLDYLEESDNEDADIIRKLINDLKKCNNYDRI